MKEKYTMKELFDFMDTGKTVKVTSKSGKTYVGECWAYGDVQNESDYGIAEPSIEVQDTVLFSSEIEKIEFVEDSEDK